MKKTLIIGGSGFIGSYLIKELNVKKSINFDKNQSPFFPEITTVGNILDKEALDNAFKEVESVILLAAEHKDDVSPTSLYYDVNVNGTKNVLNAMDKHNVKKLIFTSSVAVYGLNKENPNENFEVDPFNHYGKSKWLAENEIKLWYKNSKDKSIMIIRPTVVFGERNRGNVYNLLKQIVLKRFIMVGNGNNKKSMAYVRNLVSFIKTCNKETKKGLNIVNYADKPDLTMTNFVNLIKENMGHKKNNFKIPFFVGFFIGCIFDLVSYITNRKFRISSVRIKKFCSKTEFDSSKLNKIFKAPYTIQEGLKKTIEYEFLSKNEIDITFDTE